MFETKEDAEAAAAALNGTSLNGSVLNVTLEPTPGAEGNQPERAIPPIKSGDGGVHLLVWRARSRLSGATPAPPSRVGGRRRSVAEVQTGAAGSSGQNK